MKAIIDKLLVEYQRTQLGTGSFINKVMTEVHEGKENTLPVYHVFDNYFFEVWIRDYYSVAKQINGSYWSDDVEDMKAGWNDMVSHIKAIKHIPREWYIVGEKELCKDIFDRMIMVDLVDYKELMEKGFDPVVFNYKDEFLARLFAGHKMCYAYIYLLYRIYQIEREVVVFVNESTADILTGLINKLKEHKVFYLSNKQGRSII